MNNGKICISVCASDVEGLLDGAKSACDLADIVEVRLDCLRDTSDDLSALPIGCETIVTLRPREEGGHTDLTRDQRIGFWSEFSLDCGADLELDVFAFAAKNIFPKICSYHDFTGPLVNVGQIYDQISATIADVLKIAVATKDASDATEIWQLLLRAKADGRKIVPIAMGEAGKWTRILGLAHGSYLTYASLGTGNETAPGQITAAEMNDVFRVKELDEETEIYGIIAGDTTYSMSPYIHNAGFKKQGMNAVFVPFQVSDLEAFMTRMVRSKTREVELNFRGFSVTNPHKQAIIKYLDNVDDAAAKIGAVNTIKIVDGNLHGFNTDAGGFISPLSGLPDQITSARAAIIGAGGAARSCIYALKHRGADVTVFARDVLKAEELSRDFEVNVRHLDTGNSKPATSFSEFDIVVNSTPVGTRGENVKDTLATVEQLNGVKIVYDLVYNPSETLLLSEAKKAGAKTIGGFDMLIAQAAEQFRIWTGRDAPTEVMSTAARKRLYDR